MSTNTEHWHLSKSVSITQIISIVMLAAGLFIWGSDVEKGIDANRQAIKHEAAMRELEQRHLAEFKDEIRTRLQRIDTKLDALIERAQ
ncbi:hypothetical protein [Microbulbifer thermotolerans]|uniref:Uncharacterized protein n=1 Tax=Microbulbifer thermotolerans TaxID=252514 RepID=A0AB35I0M1_MICTH|nr:hypothetical protein [Microbulbifer thermotolerans]MCX2780414.1 hypothetical protein [Microbulbifer thermotolerans]MCX2802248.1 hypothetical protein [Microbulbifer thermotolerans]MCX2805914.1 hypothetical protein [Microbulbifer thermotolerans]